MDDKRSKILSVPLSIFRSSWIFFIVPVVVLSETASLIVRSKASVGSKLGGGGGVFLGVAILAIFGVFAWFAILNQKTSEKKEILGGDDDSFIEKVPKFQYEELTLATNNFSSVLGRGGSSCVFKGTLREGTCVAVKRTMQGQEHGKREFQAELAGIMRLNVQNANIVQLLGYCVVPRGPRFLIYEFIPNGSLDSWIFPHKHNGNQPRGCLPLKSRYKVAIDVAKALSYLHNARILHLDVKPENILLDSSFQALVSDFGLAELMGEIEGSIVVKRVRGTREYLAPEWILQGRVSAKTDVYSYGMLLLEMIGGQRNIRKHDDIKRWEYFPKIVFDKMKAGKLLEALDKRLMDKTVDENVVRKLAYVALWCVQEKIKLRPNMAQAIDMLEGRLPVNEPPETGMFFLDLLVIQGKASVVRTV
uniref:Protein kinase domain-containing protein n=1 Tax=Opuntia streptacantha TaxID=393608 RepID=A0A7C9ALB0_OPUST